MPFQESSETLQSRLHLGRLKPSTLIFALMAFSVLVAVAMSLAVNMVGGGSFSVQKESSSPADADVSRSPEDGKLTDEALDQREADPEPVDIIAVHVSGCVGLPGVYYLEEGSRVHDAIACAGGFTDEAARGYVNEARELTDGEQIVIPSAADLASLEQGHRPVWLEGDPDLGVAGGLVNINTATSEQLQGLDGIGEVTAARIIADREQNGPFESVEDIQRVSGIGEKKFAAIRESICV